MICDPDNLTTDFFMLRDGPVLVMSDPDLCRAGSDWLTKRRGYKLHRWQLASEGAYLNEVSETLKWHEQFGHAPWAGGLDALNDAATNWPLPAGRHLVRIENAERLKSWFGGKVPEIWEVFAEAARIQLLFGVGVMFLVNTASGGEVERWARKPGVAKLDRKSFPGAQLVLDAGKL